MDKLKYIVAGVVGFACALGWIVYMDSLNEPGGITTKQIVMLIVLFVVAIAGMVISIIDMNKMSESVSQSIRDVSIISELMKNGYSDEMIEMTKEATKKSVSNPNLYLKYRDEVLFLVNAYFYRHDYYEAINWLETLSIDKLRKYSNKETINGYGSVSYYDAWMILCRVTRDYNKAEELFMEAEKDIAEYAGQKNEVGILIEEIYYEYFFLVGNLDRAKEHAVSIDQLYKDFNPKSVSPDITMAEICKAMGDIDGYKNRVQIAEEKINKSNNALFKAMFDDFIEKTKE